MKVMTIFGGTGRGKSHFIKNEILLKLKHPPLIFDPQFEYHGDEYIVPELDEFIELIKLNKKSLVIFEEARLFFRNNNSNKLKEIEKLLLSKRHNSQFFIFVFQALHQLPVEINDYTTTYVMFKTDERASLVKAKFGGDSKIFHNFEIVRKEKDDHFYQIF